MQRRHPWPDCVHEVDGQPADCVAKFGMQAHFLRAKLQHIAQYRNTSPEYRRRRRFRQKLERGAH